MASGNLCIHMVGLCYDTPSGEARLLPVAVPEQPPWALSEDFFQETFPYTLLPGRVRRNLGSREALLQKTSPVQPACGSSPPAAQGNAGWPRHALGYPEGTP